MSINNPSSREDIEITNLNSKNNTTLETFILKISLWFAIMAISIVIVYSIAENNNIINLDFTNIGYHPLQPNKYLALLMTIIIAANFSYTLVLLFFGDDNFKSFLNGKNVNLFLILVTIILIPMFLIPYLDYFKIDRKILLSLLLLSIILEMGLLIFLYKTSIEKCFINWANALGIRMTISFYFSFITFNLMNLMCDWISYDEMNPFAITNQKSFISLIFNIAYFGTSIYLLAKFNDIYFDFVFIIVQVGLGIDSKILSKEERIFSWISLSISLISLIYIISKYKLLAFGVENVHTLSNEINEIKDYSTNT